MVSRVIPVEPFDLVIFGGTGDLARRKILPGLFRRFMAGQMPQNAQIIGAARADHDADGYREFARQALLEFGPKDVPSDVTNAFLSGLAYVAIDAKGTNGWTELAAKMRAGHVRAFYFSVAPALFGDLAERLHSHEIALPDSRIVVEKPFGHDLKSAQLLNATLAQHFFRRSNL